MNGDVSETVRHLSRLKHKSKMRSILHMYVRINGSGAGGWKQSLFPGVITVQTVEKEQSQTGFGTAPHSTISASAAPAECTLTSSVSPFFLFSFFLDCLTCRSARLTVMKSMATDMLGWALKSSSGILG